VALQPLTAADWHLLQGDTLQADNGSIDGAILLAHAGQG